jgi:hypothetical protein
VARTLRPDTATQQRSLQAAAPEPTNALLTASAAPAAKSPDGAALDSKPNVTNESARQLSTNASQVGLASRFPGFDAVSAQPPAVADTNIIRYGLFTAAPRPNENRPGGQMSPEAARDSVAKAAPAPGDQPLLTNAVLFSFQVEQSGQQLRVIDSDGSVYSGYIRAAPRTSPAAPEAAQPVQVNRSGGRQIAASGAPQTNFSFRVTGTNRSLNQAVVFSGDLLRISNAPALAVSSLNQPTGGGFGGGGGAGGMGRGGGGFGGGGMGGGGGRGGRAGAGRGGGVTADASPSASARPVSPAPQSFRIAGKAVIGQGEERDIEALLSTRGQIGAAGAGGRAASPPSQGR